MLHWCWVGDIAMVAASWCDYKCSHGLQDLTAGCFDAHSLLASQQQPHQGSALHHHTAAPWPNTSAKTAVILIFLSAAHNFGWFLFVPAGC
jgi:hypothetical protein